MNNKVLVERLLQRFMELTNKDIADLERAVTTEHAREVKTIAHRIKGAAATIYADNVFQAALTLETMGSEGDLSESVSALENLMDQMNKFSLIASTWMRTCV